MTLNLVTIATGHQLAPGPAASYARMCAAARATLPVTSAYRSTERQAELHAGWVKRLPGYAFALPPGSSLHERGAAVDFAAGAYSWLEQHATAHGWRRTNPLERWHYEYDPTRDRHLADTPPPPAPPAPAAPPPPQEDDDMRGLIEALYRVGLGREGSTAEVDAWTLSAAEHGLTGRELRALFLTSEDEPGTVRRAYADYLGRQPSDAEVADWLAQAPTIAAVRAGVAGSPEAQKRK